jgi:cation/acetate symporter
MTEHAAFPGNRLTRLALPGTLLTVPARADTITGPSGQQTLNVSAIIIFLVFVALTLFITWVAAKKTRSRTDFYAAGGSIPAWQNGFAIAGDFISAATLLGVTSALYASGFDGFLFIIGAMVSWPVILFMISERLRNLGRFTFIDVTSYRLDQRPIRLIASLGSLSVVIFYLIGQVVGAGKLIQLLFGLEYIYAVIIVSTLMMIYVSFGGMLATTWVQFIKAVLLLAGGTVLVLLLLFHFKFSISNLLESAVAIHPLQQDIMQPGRIFTSPLAILSMGLTSLFGFIGLPHILMRMFTVKNAREARKSSFYTIGIVGYFYILIIFMGFGAMSLVMNNPEFHDAGGQLIGGGNMVALHLTSYLGGNLLLGFMSAVTFATILAVVAGLTLSGAATIAHDLYAKVFCKDVDEKKELMISRLSVLFFGILAICLGILFEDQNIVFIVNMALAIAASVNAPVLIMAMYWKDLTTRGAVYGGAAGLVSSIGLIMVNPIVMVDIMGFDQAWFPYDYPTVVSMPLAFITAWLFSVTDKSTRAVSERQGFVKQYVCSETGIEAT